MVVIVWAWQAFSLKIKQSITDHSEGTMSLNNIKILTCSYINFNTENIARICLSYYK